MIQNKDFLLSSYNYKLEENLIAQKPSNPQHQAKLLVCTNKNNKYIYSDKKIIDLVNIIDSDSILFFNDTKVYKARLKFKNKKTIRKTWKEHIIQDGEILIYKIIDNQTFYGLSSDDKNFKPWTSIFRNKNIKIISKSLRSDWIIFEIVGEKLTKFLSREWEMPLPPYIQYNKSKEKRYQSNFAKDIWSAAAPTASLHFTKLLLDKLKKKWIKTEFNTLHIWLGTFKPVFEKDIRKHQIHEEDIIIDPSIFTKIAKYKSKNKNLIAVWTTTVRLIETLPYLRKSLKTKKFSKQTNKYRNNLTKGIIKKESEIIVSNIEIYWKRYKVSTRLFIIPWFKYKIVDQIITNFHLPQSSLIMMISWFMWRNNILKTYKYAQKNWYKFYSFWDAMLIKNKLITNNE